MTGPMDIAAAIVVLISAAAFLALVYGPWQWLWTDWYRMHLFAVRATLFDMAADGRIAFEDPR